MGCIQMNRYPKEQKERILELYRSGHKVTDLAREYGIAEATIYKWKAELTPSKETGMTVEEIKAMKKEMAKIKEENEIMENRWICGFKNSDKKWPKS